MGPRDTLRPYQLAARLWLLAAGLALLLPPAARRGLWLPLHLSLAGAVSAAISGAMQGFAATLTATPTPPPWAVRVQFGLVNGGALLVAAGVPLGWRLSVAVGGGAFVAGMVLLGGFVARAGSRALNRRHLAILRAYLLAVASIVVGGVLGSLLGSGLVEDPGAWLRLRRVHVVLNVLGFASGTIVATLVTLLPTVLRVRMPRWPRGTVVLVALGVGGLAAGLGVEWPLLAALGGLAFLAAAGSLAALVLAAVRTPRRWPAPVQAKHFVLAVAWFVAGSVGLAVAGARGGEGFDGYRQVFLLVFVGGWVLQTLLAAWLYLLPLGRPGHPDERRRQLAGVELGADLQVAAGNLGLVLLVVRSLRWAPAVVGALGAGLTLGAAALALLKAWAYPWIPRVVTPSRQAARTWGRPGGLGGAPGPWQDRGRG